MVCVLLAVTMMAGCVLRGSGNAQRGSGSSGAAGKEAEEPLRLLPEMAKEARPLSARQWMPSRQSRL